MNAKGHAEPGIVAVGKNAAHAVWAIKKHLQEDIFAVAVDEDFCAEHMEAFQRHVGCPASTWTWYQCTSGSLSPTEQQYLATIQECVCGKSILFILADCEEKFVRSAVPFIICALEETGAFIVSVTTLHHDNRLAEGIKSFMALSVHSQIHIRFLSGLRLAYQQGHSTHSSASALLKGACLEILHSAALSEDTNISLSAMHKKIHAAINSILIQYICIADSDMLIKRTTLSCELLQVLAIAGPILQEISSPQDVAYLAMHPYDSDDDAIIISSIRTPLRQQLIFNSHPEWRLSLSRSLDITPCP